MKWKIRDRFFEGRRVFLMGVLNVTPDSFSDGGKFLNPEEAARQAERLVAEGADLLDLGAESTRPGARAVGLQEELDRILPALEAVRKKVQAPLSIDTTKSEVARACLRAGADIVNDVSGLAEGGGLAKVAAEFGAGLVLMHRRGDARTMQSQANYQDVVSEVMEELGASLEKALHAGAAKESLVIDPGLGFAKTAEQNFEILRNLERFTALGYPVLLGASRKSFLGPAREPGQREAAHAAVCAAAVFKGVSILRVHNVQAVKDAVRTAEFIIGDQHVRTF